MASLTGSTIASSYEQLLSLPDGGGNGATLVVVTDGDAGTTFALQLSTIGIAVDSNFTGTTTATTKAAHIDFDATGITASGQTATNIGLDLDMNSNAPTMVGTVVNTGIDLDLTAGTSGTQTNVGVNIAVTGADTNYALITSGGAVGIGIAAPDGTLHAHTATCGSQDAHAEADDLVVENSDHAGISILTPNDKKGHIMFGDVGGELAGRITYDHNVPSMAFYTEETLAMTIDTNQNVGIGATPTNNLHIEADAGDEGITIHSAGNTSNAIISDANRSSAGGAINQLLGKWNGTTVADVRFIAGSDTTNKDDGEITFHTSSANNLTERMRILAGGGITFNGETATASALDGYEEGTWTPTVSEGTTNASVTAMYVKIGRLVTIKAYVHSGSETSSTNMWAINNLPFSADEAFVGACKFHNANFPAGVVQAVAELGSDAVNINYTYDNANWGYATYAEIAGAHIQFTATYFTDE
jgi:hypothetical protein